MLIVVLGKRGSGKTLWMCIQALRSKRTVLSNFKIKSPNYKQLKIVDLLNLPDDIEVMLDEAYAWIDARVSGSVINRYMSYIVLQSRKRTINIFMSAQMFRSLDVRIRQQVDLLIKCERLGVKPKGTDTRDFRYSSFEVQSQSIKTYILKYNKAIKYFSKFDTYQIIDPSRKSQLELELLKESPKRLFQKIKLIAKDIKNDLNKITHSTVKATLLKKGYSTSYEGYVYDYLHNNISGL